MKKMHKKKHTNTNLLIFGKHPVLSAIKNNKRKIEKIFLTKDNLKFLSPKEQNLFKIEIVSNDKLNALTGEATHQGFAAECHKLEEKSLYELKHISDGQNSLVILLDQVTDAHNFGAIIRSCAAFKADAIIIPEHNSAKENNSTFKTSAGTLDLIDIIVHTNLNNAIIELQKMGYWIIGLDGKAKHILEKYKFPKKTALVLGSEGKGLRKLVSENCDDLVKISIADEVESLNVSNAAAITCYAYRLQHFL